MLPDRTHRKLTESPVLFDRTEEAWHTRRIGTLLLPTISEKTVESLLLFLNLALFRDDRSLRFLKVFFCCSLILFKATDASFMLAKPFFGSSSITFLFFDLSQTPRVITAVYVTKSSIFVLDVGFRRSYPGFSVFQQLADFSLLSLK